VTDQKRKTKERRQKRKIKEKSKKTKVRKQISDVRCQMSEDTPDLKTFRPLTFRLSDLPTSRP